MLVVLSVVVVVVVNLPTDFTKYSKITSLLSSVTSTKNLVTINFQIKARLDISLPLILIV